MPTLAVFQITNKEDERKFICISVLKKNRFLIRKVVFDNKMLRKVPATILHYLSYQYFNIECTW